MNRYLIFCFTDFYPSGGWNDFVQSFPDLDKAETFRQSYHRKDVTTQIVDLLSSKVIISQYELNPTQHHQ